MKFSFPCRKNNNRYNLYLFFSTISLRTCLTELKEQADSDGNFIGKTFEQLRDLYAEKYPEFFEEDDLDF